jgi:hypothetical protein
MGINVKVTKPGQTAIRFTTNANPIVIRNDALIAANRLAGLEDVVMANTANGTTLIYDSSDSKFVLESPDDLIINITNVDGGTF